jgi:short-subunit dehydrogenase
MRKYENIVVVGASSGIGASIVRRFLAEGSTVFGVARDLTKMKGIKKSLPKEQQSRFKIVTCDIRDNTAVKTAINKVFKDAVINLVVANAGVGFGKPLREYTDDEVDTVIDTNLRGTIAVVRASLAARKQGALQIVCTTSLAGKVGFPEMSIYSASKFGIEGFIESLRHEYDPGEVAFTILRPGITATPFFKKAGMEAFQESVKDLKSYYSPDKVADIFYEKLSPKVRVITVGNDKYFLAMLPFIPFKYRFKVLDLVNKF